MFTVMVNVTTSPTFGVLWSTVFIKLKSAILFGVSVSVSVLFPGFGSVVPAGGVTVAVFTRLPV